MDRVRGVIYTTVAFQKIVIKDIRYLENASNVESNQIAEKESIMFFCVQSNGLMWKLNVRMSVRADFNLTNLPSQPNL